MHPKRQLEFIISGKVALAVNDYLDGDWSRVQALFTLPRTLFDEWADSVELPYGRVFRKQGRADGTYVLQDAEGWLVMKQKSGVPLPGKRIYATYKEARRAALAWEFLEVLRGTAE
jgi:hypothetical protein